MRLPNSLRDFLSKTVPAIGENPDRLHVFIDQGKIASTATRSRAFEYRYRLNLILTDFAEDPDRLMVPLLIWISRYQSTLLHGQLQGREPFGFEVDVLDHGKVDVSIEIELAENVTVEPREGGGYTVDHPPEPPFEPPFEGVPSDVRLWELFLKDELIASALFPDGEGPIP